MPSVVAVVVVAVVEVMDASLTPRKSVGSELARVNNAGELLLVVMRRHLAAICDG